MSAFGQDIRYALRSFMGAPGFTLVALITLALGIGGTAAIFSIVDGIVLRPLPYSDPGHVTRLLRHTSNGNDGSFSAAGFLDVKHDATNFAFIAGYRDDIIDMNGKGDPVRIEGMQTTAAFFDVFGVKPLLGRTYSEATDKPGAAVAVIGEKFWRKQFGGSPTAIGSEIRLNGAPMEIIGVVPDWFRHPAARDVWTLSPKDTPVSPFNTDARGVHFFSALGRIKPDVSLVDAREQLKSIQARLAKDFPDDHGGEMLDAEPLARNLVADVRTAMFVLLGSVAFVLLIACANVAGLLIARGASRRRELAVRVALGAGRGRLIRQLLTESLVLALAGGALGMLVANWALDALIAVAPENIPRLQDVTLDWRVAMFALASTMIVGVLFGMTPALQASKLDANTDLKDGGRTGTARSGARNTMVVAQIALALVLLIGAGLMLTSFSRLRSVDPGVRTTDVVTVELMLPIRRYDEAKQRRFYADVLERLRANPITAQSAMMFPFPFGGGNAQAEFIVKGQPKKPKDQETAAELNSISPGYIQTVGLRLIRGRDFTEADGEKAPAVALINEAAIKEFGGTDPIGQQLDMGDPITIVGIVSNSKRRSLDQGQVPALYLPYQQFTLPYIGALVRTDKGAGAVAAAVRAAVADVDRDLPIGDVKTIDTLITESTGQPRFRSFLVASFAGLALLLAAVGVYGLISFTVAQRVPEIGVRLALGADPWQVFRLVIGQGLKLGTLGVVLGLLAAVATTRLMTGLLFNTSATDPIIYVSLSVLLLGIAAVACYVPARRAMRVDPMTALRSE